jgi:hypothetical protein
MMKHQTLELTGIWIDAAVAKALGMKSAIRDLGTGAPRFKTYQTGGLDCGPSESDCGDDFEPSRLWGHGGPIIDREHIALEFEADMGVPDWTATHPGCEGTWPKSAHGPSALVAAMKAFIRAKIGDEVDFDAPPLPNTIGAKT